MFCIAFSISSISRIKANKKLALKESKKFEDLTLNEEELKQWLQAFDEDLKNDRMELKDYALFYTTFFLSDRKSETYALQWKHINFGKNEILIEQAGLSLEAISEALTHSDKEVTKTYVNTKDTVNQTVGDIAFCSLKK